MEVRLDNVGRKFGQEWIFRGVSTSFRKGEKCAIIGNNGSGKSTLIKVISSALLPSEGAVHYQSKGETLDADQIYSYVSLVAPYTMLPEELTLMELLAFVRKFRPLSYANKELIQKLRLESSKHKQVKYFSSGMKQRLQLGLALYAESPIILLDEPSSNLDQENTDWYLSLVEKPMEDKIVLISSNMAHEYACCSREIHIKDYK